MAFEQRDTARQRRIFDQYVSERRACCIDGFDIDLLPFASRYVPRSSSAEPFLSFTNLPVGDERRLIREQIAFFEGRGEPFEWKVYDLDRPSNLRQLLELEGFVTDPPEAFMVFSLDQGLRSQPADSQKFTVRDAAWDDRTIDDVVKIQESVWRREFSWLNSQLRDTLRAHSDQLSIYCAYHGGIPAGCGWIDFPPNSRFADLHGGAVVEELRGQGIYSLLFQRRAQEAQRRGYHYLTVDAAPMSRPILERAGFEYVCGTYPMKMPLQAQRKSNAI